MPDLVIPPKFKKIFQSKPPAMQAAIMESLKRLEEDPRSPSLQAHRMQGHPGVWEAYVDRGNRITFHYDADGTIVMRNNCNHDMLQRRP